MPKFSTERGRQTRREIVAYIIAYTRATMHPPTLQEICEACDIPTKSMVAYHIGKLIEQNVLRRTIDAGEPRSRASRSILVIGTTIDVPDVDPEKII